MAVRVRYGAAAALLLLIAGCAAGTLRELDRMKELAAAGDDAAVAAVTVGCTGGPGCAQAHAIKADACLALAREAAVDARGRHAACARAGYGRALAALADDGDPRVDAARLRRQRLEAVRLERDVAAPDRGLALNRRLAEAAGELVAAGGDPAVAAFYTANARAFAVAFGDADAPCATLADAAERAAAADAPALGDAPAQLRRDIANLRRAEGCVE